MARQEGILRFSGKIGGLVGYSRGKGNFSRSAPKSYELSPGSKNSGNEFGRGSSASALLRQAFSSIFLESFRKDPQNRLAERFRQVIRSGPMAKKGQRTVIDGDLSLLEGFEFNRYAAFSRLVSFQPEAEIKGNVIEISVPDFIWGSDVRPPEKASALIVGAICGSFDFAAQKYQTTQAAELKIDDRTAFSGAGLTIPLPDAEEQVIIVMMTLSFTYGVGRSTMIVGRRDSQAGMILCALLVRNGELVEFEKEEEIKSVDLEEPMALVSWKIN